MYASRFDQNPVSWFVQAYGTIQPLADYQWPSVWGHPEHHGFTRLWLFTKPRPGKTEDWVCSLEGHGRLHAQLIFGQWYFHWDEFDPAQNQIEEHLEEAGYGEQVRAGKALAGMALAFSAVVLAAKALDEWA